MKVKDAKDILKVGDWVRVKDVEFGGSIVVIEKDQFIEIKEEE